MRLNEYKSIEEILEDSRMVTKMHCGLNPIEWLPDPTKLIMIIGPYLSGKIMESVNYIEKENINYLNIYPSDIIKGAHFFQLSLKGQSDFDNKIINTYIKLINLSIAIRNYYTHSFNKILQSSKINMIKLDSEYEKKQLLFLNALLRACSETIYFDNHTSGGDVFGIFDLADKKVIIKSFTNIISNYIFPEDEFKQLFKKINIYMYYEKFDASFDMIGNCISNCDVNEYLSGYAIEIVSSKNNSCFLEIKDIAYIIDYYKNILSYYTNKIKNMSEDEKNIYAIKGIINIYKPIFDYSKVNYELSNEEIIRMFEKNNKSANRLIKKINSFSYKESIEIVIDPRKKII